MKIVLSRKGFDSVSGGCPSPIFPDASMLSLPIPDKGSGLTYGAIKGNAFLRMGQAVSDLAGVPEDHRAHLDPDLVKGSLPREKGWRPIFGQAGAAEGHLRRQRVGPGDLFLFFGLFRAVENTNGRWRFVRGSKPVHTLFGWLQVAERIPVASWRTSDSWALYHPHFRRKTHPNNVIYVATERMALPSGDCSDLAGAGVFPQFNSALCLTAPNSNRPSQWLLPKWFYPEGRPSCLSYHGAPDRWFTREEGVLLDSVSRGQEFVLDTTAYPEAAEWLKGLFDSQTLSGMQSRRLANTSRTPGTYKSANSLARRGVRERVEVRVRA